MNFDEYAFYILVLIPDVEILDVDVQLSEHTLYFIMQNKPECEMLEIQSQ
jgi:hypothetical protein